MCISYKDFLKALEQKSTFIASLNFNKAKSDCIAHGSILTSLFHDVEQLTIIADTIEKIGSKNKKAANEILSNLLSNKPDGCYYELLAYEWLFSNNIVFEPQVQHPEKSNILDGCFSAYDTKIYFDIKTFEVPYNCLDALERRISEKFLDYNVQVLDGYTSSYDDLRNFLSSPLFDTIIENLKSHFNNDKSYSSFKNNYFQIKLFKKGVHRSSSFYCSINPYRWASENKKFFLDKSKRDQFTTKAPFISICLYSEKFTFKDVNIRLRSIARRTFINSDESAKYLSAILFLNISNKSNHFFVNPNAENKIDMHALEKVFFEPTNRCLWSQYDTFDDFEFDNY